MLFPVLFDFFRPVLPNRLSMQFVLYALALAFGITTAVANPILYTSLNESFRQTLKARRMMGGWQRGSTATSSATTRRSTMKNDSKVCTVISKKKDVQGFYPQLMHVALSATRGSDSLGLFISWFQ